MSEETSNKIKINVKAAKYTEEDDIYFNIGRNSFLKKLKEENLDINKLLLNGANINEDYFKFNFLLSDLHRTGESSINESISYLEDSLEQNDYKDLFKCLNSENFILLKSVIKSKYNIKSKIFNKNKG